MRTKIRSFRQVFVAVLLGVCGLAGGLVVSCNPGTDVVDNEIPPPPPMPDLLPPPLMCDAGTVRCNPNRDGIEQCDGMVWNHQSDCDTASGEQCVDGECKSACDLLSRGNVGCSFYPINLWSTSTDGQLGIVVTNTSDKLTANLSLDDASGNHYDVNPVTHTSVLPPGGVAIYKLPHATNKLSETEQAQKGFHLTSTAPVAVYQFHPIDAAFIHSGSATLLLPEHVMAKSYFIMSYTYNAALSTFPPQGQGSLAIVALSDNTLVQVKVPVATKSGPGVAALKPGDTLKKTLNRLEVLEIIQVNSLDDISGATVTASAPVAVYGGAGGVTIPYSAIGGNHLGVQMFPLETWGKSYLAAKVKQRNASDHDYFRIVASVDNTEFTLTGGPGLPKVLPKLMSGQIFEFSTSSDFQIDATQPILAFQYMPAWGNLSGPYDKTSFPDGLPADCPYINDYDNVKCLGDANITPLVPVEQYRDDYIFYVPETYKYNFVTVTAPLDAKLTLDGTLVSDAFTQITPTTGRVILRLTKTGNHRLTGTKPFGIIGYGYAYATSYSYVGGLDLRVINPG